MSQTLQQLGSDAYLDRIDFQLSELRSIIKKVFPKAMASLGIQFQEDRRDEGDSDGAREG
jgi:hypothetical protein